MPELSNLVRQRLASGERMRVHSGSHPDADTLTAYAEQLLTAQERSQVLAHLSTCADCREVVALSLPELETATPAVAAAPALGQRRFAWKWKWRSSFGLAASVAALAVVTLVVIEAPRKQVQAPVERASQTAAEAPASTAPATSAEKNTTARSELESANADARSRATSPGTVGDISTSSGPIAAKAVHESPRERDGVRMAPPVPPPPSPMIAASAGAVLAYRADRQDYKNDMFEEAQRFEARNTALNDLPAAPAPQANQNLFAINNSLSVPTLFSGVNANAASTTVRITSPASAGRRAGVVAMVGGEIKDIFSPKRYTQRYTPAISGKNDFLGTAMGGPGLNPAKDKDQSVEIAAASPALEKEKAAGYGGLAQASALSAAARGVTVTGLDVADKKELASAWKVSDGKLWKSSDSATWVEGYSGGEAIAFSVVSPRGLEIWAGGAGAALVHSRDGGVTWERITLGASATGTITGIENTHSSVRVKSSSGQSWSTVDGGKSWALQD